jgi:predicted metal-dependent HD superfamily phosphohydrolase
MRPKADPRWLRLWGALGAVGDPEPPWLDLVARYGEPARAYHTLSHVDDCLRELERERRLARDAAAVEAALWYHDAVYDPRGKSNEEQSAELARRILAGAQVVAARVDAVERMILATRHGDGAAPSGDEALVADVDLAILGQGRDRFDRYEDAIRREYAFVPEEVYRRKRGEVLRRFLARPRLYSTDPFRDRYEALARANLARGLKRLE